MKIGQRIHDTRISRGLTLQELGDKVGVGAGTVHKWESGFIENVRTDKIAKIAKALNVTAAYIMGWEDNPVFSYNNIEALPETKTVPVIGAIACGKPILADENFEGTAFVDGRVHADFALRCVGDSMINAHIFNGDLVFIKQQPDVDNGQIAAVAIDNEATLKRVYKYPNRVELRPENPLFPVLQFEGEEMQNVRILGRAVAFLGAVR